GPLAAVLSAGALSRLLLGYGCPRSPPRGNGPEHGRHRDDRRVAVAHRGLEPLRAVGAGRRLHGRDLFLLHQPPRGPDPRGQEPAVLPSPGGDPAPREPVPPRALRPPRAPSGGLHQLVRSRTVPL